jgi:hypothetical protein
MPVVVLHTSAVQALLSLQFFGAPGWHAPLLQASSSVHALPSLQGVVLFTAIQLPLTTSQKSLVQALLSLHTFGVLEQTPLLHTSIVQELPSLHEPVAAGA